MENSKKIAIILGIGGIALVVFYFIRKSKPTVADEQLSELNTNTTSPIQEELETTPTLEEQRNAQGFFRHLGIWEIRSPFPT